MAAAEARHDWPFIVRPARVLPAPCPCAQDNAYATISAVLTVCPGSGRLRYQPLSLTSPSNSPLRCTMDGLALHAPLHRAAAPTPWPPSLHSVHSPFLLSAPVQPSHWPRSTPPTPCPYPPLCQAKYNLHNLSPISPYPTTGQRTQRRPAGCRRPPRGHALPRQARIGQQRRRSRGRRASRQQWRPRQRPEGGRRPRRGRPRRRAGLAERLHGSCGGEQWRGRAVRGLGRGR
jgi:hypothetical protein